MHVCKLAKYIGTKIKKNTYMTILVS